MSYFYFILYFLSGCLFSLAVPNGDDELMKPSNMTYLMMVLKPIDRDASNNYDETKSRSKRNSAQGPGASIYDDRVSIMQRPNYGLIERMLSNVLDGAMSSFFERVHPGYGNNILAKVRPQETFVLQEE